MNILTLDFIGKNANRPSVGDNKNTNFALSPLSGFNDILGRGSPVSKVGFADPLASLFIITMHNNTTQ